MQGGQGGGRPGYSPAKGALPPVQAPDMAAAPGGLTLAGAAAQNEENGVGSVTGGSYEYALLLAAGGGNALDELALEDQVEDHHGQHGQQAAGHQHREVGGELAAQGGKAGG